MTVTGDPARDADRLLAEVLRLWRLAGALPPAQRASYEAPIRAAAERYVAVTQSDRRKARIARAPTSPMSLFPQTQRPVLLRNRGAAIGAGLVDGREWARPADLRPVKAGLRLERVRHEP